MSTVLVTGAAGYLGTNIVNRLRNNYHVYSFIRPSNQPNINGNFALDLTQEIPPEIELPSPIVIHAAAQKPSHSKDKEMIRSNILGTLNMLEWAIKNNARKFIYISTGSVYGYKQNYYHKEDDELNPIGVYGQSKYLGEELVELFHKTYELSVIIIRLFYPYGANQSTGIFSILKEKLLNNQTITVNNNGQQRINPIHIDDCVKAVELLLTSPDGYQVYNLCGNEAISVFELIRLLEKRFNKTAQIENTSDNKTLDLLGSNTKIKKILNWEQLISINTIGFPDFEG